MSLLGHPKVISYTSLNTLGSFVFELCCGQTDKQTDGLENPTHADSAWVNTQVLQNGFEYKPSTVQLTTSLQAAITQAHNKANFTKSATAAVVVAAAAAEEKRSRRRNDNTDDITDVRHA